MTHYLDIQMCCDRMKDLQEYFKKTGGLNSDKLNVDVTYDGVFFNDDWNFIPPVQFVYCPFCGTQLKEYI